MATEYKCDICGKPATFHITKILNGKKVKVHLCSECAEKASLDAANLPLDLFPKLKELEKKIMSAKSANPDSCPTCGASLSEIEKGARFSCPDCYVALGNRLFELFAQMHAATEHKGKTPKTHGANCFAAIDNSKKLRDFEEIAGGELFDETLENTLDAFLSETQPVKLNAEVVEEPQTDVQAEEETPEMLQKMLDEAVAEERYEDAADLRDKLKKLSEKNK